MNVWIQVNRDQKKICRQFYITVMQGKQKQKQTHKQKERGNMIDTATVIKSNKNVCECILYSKWFLFFSKKCRFSSFCHTLTQVIGINLIMAWQQLRNRLLVEDFTYSPSMSILFESVKKVHSFHCVLLS